MFHNLKRRFDRWAARTVLCHKMRLRKNIPDDALIYLATTSGDEQLRRFGGLLERLTNS